MLERLPRLLDRRSGSFLLGGRRSLCFGGGSLLRRGVRHLFRGGGLVDRLSGVGHLVGGRGLLDCRLRLGVLGDSLDGSLFGCLVLLFVGHLPSSPSASGSSGRAAP